MAQVHLSSDAVKKVLNGSRTCILYPILEDNSSYKAGDAVLIREPWREDENGEVIYRADCENPTKFKWRPSIFLKKEDVRLSFVVTNSQKLNLLDIPDEYLCKLGVEDRISIQKEWNISIPKEKRPTMSAKLNPLVWVIEFDTILEAQNEKN